MEWKSWNFRVRVSHLVKLSGNPFLARLEARVLCAEASINQTSKPL